MGTILVVDDEPSIRITLKAFLEEDGHHVETAEEAESAMAVLKDKSMDVVVTDIILPKVSGVQLLQRIRNVSPEVLVIMMTGEPTLETASESLRHGAMDYLQKPVGKVDITKAVKNALRVKHLNDEKRRLEKENRQYLDHLEELVAERTRALTSSEAALRRQAEELAILNRLAREVGASMTVDETIRAGMRHIFDAVSPGFAVTFLLKNEELVPRGLFPDEAEGRWKPETAHRVGECLCGLCISEDRPIYCEDIHSDERCTIEECRKAGFRSFAALNLKSGTEILGVLGLASVLPKDFSREGAFLEALANEMAVGLKKSLLYEQLQKRAEEIQESLTRIKQGEAERQQLELKVRHSQKMEAIGTLAGGIAHDFNNILGAIIGYAGMMDMFDVPKDSPMKAKLNEILKAADRAKDLVQQILTFSRQTEQERKPVQLNYIVKEALKFLRASLPTTIEIRQNIADEEFITMADPTQIHQILMNLCTNAGHAMLLETGGRLKVELSALDLDDQSAERFPGLKPGPHLKLTVSDNGHGMTSEVRERIFEPFFTTKKPGEGTGMGLAVVHGIVKSHEGVITVDSELGRGTVFQIILPRIKMGKIEPAVKAAPSIPTGTERILFIDDEYSLVNLVQVILERLGYDMVAKTSSRDALELFRSQPQSFDLVITDQTMPNMTGIELAQEIKQIRPDIPVILCTGYSETATPEKIAAIGIRELINKPLDPSGLAQTIRKVLDE